MSTVILALHGAVMLLVLLAAYEDLCALRIRNVLALAVAALFIPMLFLLPLPLVVMHLVTAAVIFAITVGLFFARVFGGGDAKLLGALALWVDLPNLPLFLLTMAFTGGFLALIALGLKRSPWLPKLAAKTPQTGWFAALARGETVVPYGVAIAIAAALTLF